MACAEDHDRALDVGAMSTLLLLLLFLSGCCNFPPLYADRQVWCWQHRMCESWTYHEAE